MKIIDKIYNSNNNAHIDVFIPKMFSNASSNIKSDVRVKSILKLGVYTIFIFIAFFLSWAVIVPIEGSITAVGVVIPDIHRQEVQAIDGGKIEQILVRNGDIVEKGQALILLDATVVKNNIEMGEEKLRFFQINEFFLKSELNMDATPDISSISYPVDNDVVRNYIVSSQMLSRNKVNVMHEYIDSLENSKVVTLSEKSELLKQKEMLEKDKNIAISHLEKQDKLYKQNFVSQISVERAEQELSGIENRISNINILLHQNGQKLANITNEKNKVMSQFKTDVIKELKLLENSKQEIQYHIKNLEDNLTSKSIKAPVKGVVSSLSFNTLNGVIPSGTRVMEIVPIENKHIIEAYVSPKDIQDLLISREKAENIVEYDGFSGLKTKLRFVGVNNRKIGMVKGIMTYISQNTVIDQRTGDAAYVVHVYVPPEEFNGIGDNFQIYDGMHVAVYMKKCSRTLFAFFMEPILGFSDRALI